jgi:hypothetical protein
MKMRIHIQSCTFGCSKDRIVEGFSTRRTNLYFDWHQLERNDAAVTMGDDEYDDTDVGAGPLVL